MSLLYPLFLAGLGALSLPIVFHLIRRTPSGRMPFSSLMFLRKSPPRLVRRKSLDQVALLCLRALILALLALAFARPYLREEASADADASGGSHVAIVLDTSASMRRPGVWAGALEAVEETLRAAPPDALLSFATFDRELVTQVQASDARRLGRTATEDLIRERLADQSPGWAATDLGQALVEIGDGLFGAERPPAPGDAIVLVSDLQEGSDITDLEGWDWPAEIELRVRRVTSRQSNASLLPVPRDPALGDDQARVRLANAADSLTDSFVLRWSSGTAGTAADASASRAVHCPPGETRVLRAPDRPGDPSIDRLVLEGDGCPFDNIVYVRASVAHAVEVPFVGPRASEERGLDFFLEHALGGDPVRPVTIVPSVAAELDLLRQPFVVLELGAQVSPALVDRAVLHACDGGVVLAILSEPAVDPERDGSLETLRTLLGESDVALAEAPASEDGFALLAEVDFDHPLFAPFADPRFSDFTKIRFWRHRRVALATSTDLRALASFDDGAPFLVERRAGLGRIFLATSSWDAHDSDLARSTKFAPLVAGMLRLASELDMSSQTFHVGDRVSLPAHGSAAVRIRPPGGGWLELGEGAAAFAGTDVPGHYDVEIGERASHFTVHLDPAEGRTDPFDLDRLLRLGVPALAGAAPLARPDEVRQEHAAELEQRQKIWRWLIAAALVGLLLETYWAGSLARRFEIPAS